MEEVVSLEDFARLLMESLEVLGSNVRVILVGHSLCGGVISITMEMFPERISVAVFVTAYIPSPEIGLMAMTKMVTTDDAGYNVF